jgi:hypothetical protein
MASYESRVATAARRMAAEDVAAWTANVSVQLLREGSRSARQLQIGSAVACAANNLCEARLNLMCGSACSTSDYGNNVVSLPMGPLSFIVGPVNRKPCLYQFAAAVPWDMIPILNFVELEGSLNVQLCNDYSGFSQVSGQLALMIDGLGFLNLQEPAASLNPFVFRIASASLGLYSSGFTNFYAPTATMGANNALSFPTESDRSLLRDITNVMGNTDARETLTCFNGKRGALQLGLEVGLPDVPGSTVGAFLLSVMP